MTEFIVMRLQPERSSVDWLRVSSEGAQLSHVSTAPLDEAAAVILTFATPIIVLLPATEVLTTTVNIPIRSAAKIRAALPFALEESLAEDVENLHFAAGDRDADGNVAVAVIAMTALQALLEQLNDVGIHPQRLVAENHGLANIPGTMSVLVDHSTVMFNDGAGTEFVMQDVKPSDVLVAAGQLDQVEDEASSGRHLVAFCSAEKQAQLEHDWTALRHELTSVEVTLLPDGALPKLAATVAQGNGVNLLQGSFGPKTEYAAMFRPWRNVAALLIGLMLLSVAAKGLDYYQLMDERNEL